MFPLRPLRLATLAGLTAALGIGVVLVAGTARAEDARACIAASDGGQKLRDDHKLAAARERFTACARESCPALIRKTCQDWLAQVAAEQPTIVLGVRDGGGHDLIRVRVSIDGAVVATTLDGSPLRVDPGQHVLRFEADGFVPAEQTVLARQGETDREITVQLAPAPGAPGSTPPVSAVATPSGAVKPDTGGTASPPHESRTLNTTGWVLGGAGLVGLGVGAVFGVVALLDNDSAHCNAAKECLPGPLSEARTAAVGADIGLIAGGALLASGVTLVLVTSKKSGDGRVGGVQITPTAGAGRTGLTLRASW